MFNIHFSIERWKWNADFGIYVSNKGRFRSRDKKDLSVKINQNGYCLVHCEGTVNKYRLAHRVVMLTWCPTDDAENLTIDHKDHNKRNNAVDNLEWVTQEENWRRAYGDHINECNEVSEISIPLPKTRFDKYLILKGNIAVTIEQFVDMIWDRHHKPLCNKDGSPATKSSYADYIFSSNKTVFCGFTVLKRVTIK